MWVSLLITSAVDAQSGSATTPNVAPVAAVMVAKSISGFPSRCTLLVEALEPLKPALCVGEFDGLFPGRVHLLTDLPTSSATKLMYQATCGLQTSPVVEVAMTQANTPWVVLRTSHTKVFSQRQFVRQLWKRFFGVLSLLIFTAELCFLVCALLSFFCFVVDASSCSQRSLE
jgi:hypothetical protein